MVIYKTTNLINGKIYVGKDCNNNPRYLGSGKILKQAIKKYGRSNFKKEILELCDLSNIAERERYWIGTLNARDMKIGYNITVGGDGAGVGKNHPWFGKHHSDETKKVLSIAKRGEKNPMHGKHPSPDTLLKLSIASKGRPSAMRGKHISEETKLKIALAGIGRPSGMRGKHHTEEAKRKISENHNDRKGAKHPLFGKCGEENPNYGKHRTEEQRKAQSERQKGLGGYWFGKHLSDEHKKKVSLSQKGEKGYWFGKRQSEESNIKRSKSMPNRKGEKHPMYGRHQSAETKLRISEAMKRIREQEKQSNIKRGRKNAT